MSKDKHDDDKTLLPDISFAGCGFIGIYHVGVSACLAAYAPVLLQQRILGSSAGALAGAALIADVPLSVMAKNVLEVALLASDKVLGPFCPSFNLASILWDGLEKMLPDDIHESANGRLYISMTKVADRTNLLVHEYSSRHELMEALRASSFIPFMSGWRPPRFRGDLVFDGGYSDNLPVFDAFTITVSPFAGDASICPEDESQLGSLLNVRIPHGPTNSTNSFNLSKDNSMKLINAVVPPGIEGMEKLCKQGYKDAMRFLITGNYIKCEECQQKVREECALCDAVVEEAVTKTLPQEITEVFHEAAAKQIENGQGSVGRIFGFLVDSVRVSFSVGQVSPLKLVRKVAVVITRKKFSRPSIETCPFYNGC